MTEQELNDLHVNYLQSLIFELEEKQIADSVSKLTNCCKNGKKDFTFTLTLEDALNTQPLLVNEKLLLRFNSYREHSFFKQYNLPLKTLFTSTSHNVTQQQLF